MAESAEIKKMSVRHEAILQHIIANPTQSYGEVAAAFGVTPSWLSTIIHSHAFQEQLAVRQSELFDTAVVQPLGDKLQAAANMTLEKYIEKIPTMTTDQAINGADKILGKLGYGAKGPGAADAGGDQHNHLHLHVDKDTLEEARNRIGTHKMGTANSQAALPSAPAKQGVEIEGVGVRESG